MATTELQAIVRFRFHTGHVEEFKRLSAQCMEIVRTQDTGTLQYDTYFNDDETECVVIERFRDSDSDALIQHGENLALARVGAPLKSWRRALWRRRSPPGWDPFVTSSRSASPSASARPPWSWDSTMPTFVPAH